MAESQRPAGGRSDAGQGSGQPPSPGAQPPGWSQQPPGPAPKSSRFGRGCLIGGCGTLVGLVVIVVVIIVVAVNAGKKTTPTTHPPAADVTISACTVDPTTSIPDAKLEIINHSSKKSHYNIGVEFLDTNGTRLAEGAALSADVAPGEKVETDAGGTAQVNAKFTCKVTSVDRISAVG